MWRGMNVSFRDMLFLMVFAYLVVSALALSHVAQKDGDAKGQNPPGNVVVELRWPKNLDDDVDLWVQGPGDVPVGYSNKSGIIFDLVRDDLGKGGDPNWLNYEVAYGRGRWPGEYVVNAMLYRDRDHKFPVPATVKVSLRGLDGAVRQVLESTVQLTFEGQETTVFRFKLDDKGRLESGSVNRIHKDLRSQPSRQ